MPVFDFFLNDISPITKNLRFDVGATLPVMRVRVLDGNEIVSLAGATAVFTMKDKDGNAKILNAPAIVEGDGSSGIVRYEWTIADTDVALIYFAQFTITIAGDDLIVPNDADQVLRVVMGKSDFQRGPVIQQPVAQGVQVVPLGGAPTLDAIGRWFKVVVSALDFTDAAVEESIDLFQLPPGGIVEAIKAKHSEAFAGGAISAYTVEVGSASQTQKYMSAFDVFSAPTSTNHKVSTSGDEESHDAATPIKVTAKTIGGNVDDATAGTVEIWIKASTVLGSGGLLFADGISVQKDGAAVAGGPFKIFNFNGFSLVVDEGGGIVGITAPAAGNSPADDVTLEDTGSILRIKDNGVSNAKLRDSVGTSVIGRIATGTGNPADIVAAVDDRVLARSGGSLFFQQIAQAMLANNSVGSNQIIVDAVTDAKIAVNRKELRVHKAGNTSRFNDTLADDPDLVIVLGMGETWEVEIGLFVLVANTTPGFKYDISYTGSEFAFKTASLDFGESAASFNDDSQNGIDGTFGTIRNYFISAGTSGEKFIQIKGVVVINTGGTMSVRWAQNSLSAPDATTLQQGSYIMARRLV